MIAALRRAGSYCLIAALVSLSACGGGGSASNSDTGTAGVSSSSSSSGSSSSSSSSGSSTATATDVLTYHNDRMRTGQNLTESVLTPANVTSATFGLLHQLPADDLVDATPLVVTNVSIGGSVHTVVYVATKGDSVYAYDADSGAALLHVSLLASGETPSDTRSCDQVGGPDIGITSTPVIDRTVGSNGTIFVVAMSKDSSGGYHQRLHALDLTTLADRVPAVAITATAPGNGPNASGGTLTFAPGDYKERGALLAVNGQIYTAWASHCDADPYNGWIIAFDAATLAPSATLNYTPNGSRGAIWSVTGLAADASGTIYGMAGNGTFETTLTSAGFPNQSDYGNAVLKVSATTNALTVADYWAASNTVSESNGDVDLGSGSPLLLPDQTDASGTVQHLLIGAGKDGNVLLLNRDSLGKFSSSASTAYQRVASLLPGGLFSAFAYFNGSVYVADVGGTLKAFALSSALLPASPTSQSTATFGFPGSSPSVSANGTSNAILWAVTSNLNTAAILHAYNPANLQQEYYNSTQAASGRDAFGNGEKFVTPVVANGKVFVGTPNSVAVFGLLP